MDDILDFKFCVLVSYVLHQMIVYLSNQNEEPIHETVIHCPTQSESLWLLLRALVLHRLWHFLDIKIFVEGSKYKFLTEGIYKKSIHFSNCLLWFSFWNYFHKWIWRRYRLWNLAIFRLGLLDRVTTAIGRLIGMERSRCRTLGARSLSSWILTRPISNVSAMISMPQRIWTMSWPSSVA